MVARSTQWQQNRPFDPCQPIPDRSTNPIACFCRLQCCMSFHVVLVVLNFGIDQVGCPRKFSLSDCLLACQTKVQGRRLAGNFGSSDDVCHFICCGFAFGSLPEAGNLVNQETAISKSFFLCQDMISVFQDPSILNQRCCIQFSEHCDRLTTCL